MIRPFLDLSSGHLSPDTQDWLDAQLADAVLRAPENSHAAMIAGGKTRYGWFVYAPGGRGRRTARGSHGSAAEGARAGRRLRSARLRRSAAPRPTGAAPRLPRLSAGGTPARSARPTPHPPANTAHPRREGARPCSTARVSSAAQTLTSRSPRPSSAASSRLGSWRGRGLAPPCGMQGNGAVFAAATSIAIPKRIDRSRRAGHASRARMPMHHPNRMQPGLSRKPTGR